MKKTMILKDIVAALPLALPQLKYVDKDWGQLDKDNPAVGFPCALIDITDVDYTDLSAGWQLASGAFTVKVANQRTNSSSAHAPSTAKNNSYTTLELCDAVHLALNGFNGLHTPSEYAPLVRRGFYKQENGLKYECYAITYKTQWKEPPAAQTKMAIGGVGVDVEFSPHTGQQ